MSSIYYSPAAVTSLKQSLTLPPKIVRIEPPPSVAIPSLGLADITSEPNVQPSKYVRTFNGIHWEGMDFFLPIKIFSGFGAKILQYECGGKFPMGREAQEWLVENTVARFPDLPEEFEKHIQRPISLGEALIHRARFAGTATSDGGGNEILKFKDNIAWSPTYYEVLEAWGDLSIIFDRRRRFKLRESGLIAQYEGKPGIYVRQNPDLLEQVYLGSGKDVVARGAKGRSGDHRCLVGVYASPSAALAKQCEDAIHNILGAKRNDFQIREIPKNTRSAYTFETGIDGATVIGHLMRAVFPQYSRRLILPPETDL